MLNSNLNDVLRDRISFSGQSQFSESLMHSIIPVEHSVEHQPIKILIELICRI